MDPVIPTRAPTTHAVSYPKVSHPARPAQSPAHKFVYNNTNEKFQPQPHVVSITPTETNGHYLHHHSAAKDQWADMIDTPEEYYVEEEVQQSYQPPQFEKRAQRSVLITGLSEGTTHADITAAIKGGLLLDIHLRTFEKSASVSFLHASSADAFFKHSRRHDLYVKGKRVGTDISLWRVMLILCRSMFVGQTDSSLFLVMSQTRLQEEQQET